MMKKEEIEKILDEIDIIMANNLNEKNNIEDANVINNLSNKICDIQNIIINNQKKVESNLKNRFRITATAIQYITANNKNNIRINSIKDLSNLNFVPVKGSAQRLVWDTLKTNNIPFNLEKEVMYEV